ncbi:MAG: hypothetical protein CMM18_05110 [Rhodospirillaceae bacterium]|nr:hypothetical protein [Rhodospirillaceae bacterium]
MYKFINFKDLLLKKTRNQYLVLPKNFISISKPDSISPIFKCHVKNLQDLFLEFINDQNRIRDIKIDRENNKFRCIQYTKFFRFPDIIDVEFIEIDAELSAIAIYSRSRYGYYDFNVNKNRTKMWIEGISKKISIYE